jgi:hypothetical protein
MKSTSPAFNPFSDERVVDFRIRFEFLDENASDVGVPAVSGRESISQLEQLTDRVDEMSGKYASLEHNCWALDGTFDILPDDVTDTQTGWWSDVLSGPDCVFADPPHLTFDFGGVAVSTIGFTLAFDALVDSYATLIRATCYDPGGAIIAQDIHSNDEALAIINMPVQNYYAVRFDFLATSLPHHRIRLCECLFGIVQRFSGDSLGAVNLIYGADISARAFPSRQMLFSFNNIEKKYNLVNPGGLYAYLQDGQDIYAHAVINGEAVDMGVFEFTSASGDDDDIIGRITANDRVLSTLDASLFAGGSNTTETLQNAVNVILDGTGITASFATPDYIVSMAIPQETTKREAIRLLAQAAMCAVWIDRDGVLQIRPLETGAAVDELNADRMPSMGGIGVSEPVECVVLTVRNEYSETEAVYTSGEGRRIETVDNPCVANGQAVADWLLAQFNRRVKYDKVNRGNPAIEIGDTLKIYDAYGENRNAVVTTQEISFDGGISARTGAVG